MFQTADLSSVNVSLNYLNNSKVNKSGDNITGFIDINTSNNLQSGAITVLHLGRSDVAANAEFVINNGSDAFNFRVNQLNNGCSTNTSEVGYAIALRAKSDTWAILRNPVGSCTSEQLISGTSNESISYKGNQSVADPGKGIILKSPDGTKCGILTWSNANSLASAAITCP